VFKNLNFLRRRERKERKKFLPILIKERRRMTTKTMKTIQLPKA